MFYYARSDTHYLLYIYDMMRNELIQKSTPEDNYIEHLLERSKETSLRRYEKFVYDAEGGQGAFGWFNPLMKQSSGNFTREQFAVFRAAHKWRDELARREDESPAFIMANGALFDIARRLPPDPKALHSISRKHHT
jgi:exosome complex exonuclease RRP6